MQPVHYLALQLAAGSGSRRRARELALELEQPSLLFTHACRKPLLRLGAPAALAARIAEPRPLEHAGLLLAQAAARGQPVLTPADAGYPPRLLETSDPPLALWLVGEPRLLAPRPAVAVVGSRHASSRGRVAARSLARALASRGVSVVSGLAAGIDAAAHAGALEAAGVTWAVLGTGTDVDYPACNRALRRRLVRHGLLLSEHPPGTPPRAHHFPERNRILAGLSDVVVVVEAARRSGALITARLAVEEGREVLALPGAPWDPAHAGTNALIQEGAGLLQELDDILRLLRLPVGPQTAAAPRLPREQLQVLAALAPERPLSLDRLCAITELAEPELLARLSLLELAGLVQRTSGQGYVRLAPERFQGP